MEQVEQVHVRVNVVHQHLVQQEVIQVLEVQVVQQKVEMDIM